MRRPNTRRSVPTGAVAANTLNVSSSERSTASVSLGGSSIALVAIVLAARWIARRVAGPPTPLRLLGVGFVALGLLLVVEFTVVLWLRGLTIGEYFERRDPVAGTVYIMMLGVFAVMPLLVARK